MLKKIVIAVVTIFTGILSTRLSGWITGDLKVPLLSLKQLLVTIGFYLLLLGVLWVLETQSILRFNWPWHRFWYFRDLWETARSQRPRRIIQVTDDQQSTSLIDAVVDGQRKNLHGLLLEKLKDNARARRILILGDPGSGKTTSLEQLRASLVSAGASRLAIGKRIPVMLRLGVYNQGKLLDYARKVMQRGSRSAKKLSHGLEHLLRDGHVILLLDAIDESLGQNRDALEEIEGVLSSDEYAKASVVISGRAGDYQRSLPADMEVLEVADLSDPAILTLCRNHLSKVNSAQSESEVFSTLQTHGLLSKGGLGRNPFWLELVLEGGTFENSRTKIFEPAISALLNREWGKGSPTRDWKKVLNRDEQLLHTAAALTVLAYELSNRNQGEQIDGEEALRIFQQYLSAKPATGNLGPQDVLYLGKDAQLIDMAKLAGKDNWPPVSFRHRLIREYLTARELSKDRVLVLRAFADHAAQVSWWETLSMLATLAREEFAPEDERRKLITAATGIGNDPNRLVFAATMVESIDTLFGDTTHDSLVATLRGGAIKPHVEAVSALGRVAPGKLIKLLKALTERNDSDLNPIIQDLITQHLQSEVTQGNSSRVIASYIGDVYLREIGKQALVKIGAPAVMLVSEVLGDSNHMARWAAAEVLRDIGDPRAVDPLITVLGDDHTNVRHAAIQALGKIGDVKALVPMARSLQLKGDLADTFVDNALIIQALGDIGEPAIDELIRMLKMDDLMLNLFASSSLEQIGRPAAKALIEALKYPSEGTRQAAVKLLGSMKATEAIHPLIALLTSDDLLVEWAAADALAEIGAPAVEPLLDLLSGAGVPARIKAAEILGEIGDVRAIQPLIQILQDRGEATKDKSSKARSEGLVRSAAAEALGKIGDIRARDALLEAVQNDRLLVGVNATASLAQLGDEDALKQVHSWVGNNDPTIQYIVLESLGRIKHSSSIPYLERFLKLSQIAPDTANAQNSQLEKNRKRATKSIEEIQAALLGLKRLQDPERDEGDLLAAEPSEAEQEKLRILNAYQSLLSHQDSVVRADVMRALAERGPESAELLIRGLSDADIVVRRKAATGLGDTLASQAVGPLLNVLEKDGNNPVRRAAAESLGKIGDRAALPPLKAALKDKYLIVRIGAALALANMGEPGMLDELLSVLREKDSPKFRFLIARAFVGLQDAKAIPHLEEILERWQGERTEPDDAQFFKLTSETLAELKSLSPPAVANGKSSTSSSS